VGTSTKINHHINLSLLVKVFLYGYDGVLDLTIIFNNNQRAFVKENSLMMLSVPISNTLFKNSKL
jgi:hypothetical protein